MKSKGQKFILFIIILIGFMSYANAGDNIVGNVYVIPIKGEINPAIMQFVKASVDRAERDPATTAIIFEIDTLGGMIDQATKIRDVIIGTPLHTISYVNNRAESAGVLLTIASDNIVMASGSTIGSAETIPYTEKNISYWKSELRSTAEQRGRDPKIIEAMADRRIEISDPKEEGTYIVKEGELLNLTTKEAQGIGFTDFVGNTYEEILKNFDINYTEIVHVDQNYKIKLAQLVSSSVVLPIILSLGFLGLITEVLTPGFGIGGTVALIAFVIFFGGSILAGNASITIVMLFIAGIILLVIEALVPGFGAPGIGGVICIFSSIILASDSFALGITSVIIAFIITVAGAILLLKYAPRNKFFDRIILGTELRKDVGFTSITSKEELLGLEGVALTTLRPSGTALINDEKIDVVTEGDYIEKNDRIRIIKVEGRKIVVRKIN